MSSRAERELRTPPAAGGEPLRPGLVSVPLPPGRFSAWKITVAYALFATLWILFSDHALRLLMRDPEMLLRMSVYKGLGFVAITSVLLLVLMRRAFGTIQTAFVSLHMAEQGLRVSEARLGSILESASDAVLALDDESRIVLFNAAAERMFGCPAGEALNQPAEKFVRLPAGAMREDSLSVTGLKKDGTQFPGEASVSRSEGGGRDLTTVILRDVSRRQRHEHEIERSNHLYSALSQIHQAVVLMPSREDLLQRVCKVLVTHGEFGLAWIVWRKPNERGLRVAAMAGAGPEHEAIVAACQECWQESETGPLGVPLNEGRSLVCPDIAAGGAQEAWQTAAAAHGLAGLASFPVRERGRIDGVLIVHSHEGDGLQERDMPLLIEAVTSLSVALDKLASEKERRRAEEVAGRERLFSETMIESMPGVLYFYNSEGRFLRWNRNFETVTGFGSEEIGRMHPRDFFAVEDRPMLEERVAEVFVKGESSMEAPFLSKDGRSIPYFFTGNRIRFDGEICLVGVGIDLTARKQAEMALKELNETLELKVTERTEALQTAVARAESADRIKSAFLATMSHELRTPLNSIIGFTGIVLQGLAGPLNEEQTKQLGMVRGSARHLLELINDVLDISKIEAGQLEVRAEAFDLKASIERVAGVVKPLADRKKLALGVSVAPAIGEMVSDRRRVEQILLNLLNNAIKFTDKGEVKLIAETVGTAVQFRILDTGIGIAAKDLQTLFQPFRQIDHGLARQHEGTGLGLAICQRLAGLLHGQIRAASKGPGLGSEFVAMLPVHLSSNLSAVHRPNL